MVSRFLLGLICVLILGPEQAARGPAKCELIKTRHLALKVTINGQGPYRMIFDTGSPVVLISSRIAKECKLGDAKANKFAMAAWPGQVVLDTVEIAGITANNVPAAAFDHPTIKAIEDVVGRVDGIVGHPFFARFKTTIDYQARTISLVANGYEPKDAIQTLMTTMLDASDKKKPTVISPKAQWGLEVRKAADDSAAGVVVAAVQIGSAAANAAIKVDDRVLTIDGRWTDTVEDCIRAIAELEPNQQYFVQLMRAGKQVDISISPRAGS